ncbi:MAG: hydrolase [Lachnospiraceae bacterium]|nr:hydrolase [Lachnospiraceae bacterium]
MRADINNTIALIIDEQVKLMPVIHEKDIILHNTEILIQGLKLLDVPFIITQQYTKGMGMTEQCIFDVAGTEEYIDKRTFSCWDTDEIRQAVEASGKKQVLLAGVESHICLLQTAIDLIDAGYDVFVVENCVSSRRLSDKETAIRRMMQTGVQVTSYESILFELMRTSTHPNFRLVSKLIK